MPLHIEQGDGAAHGMCIEARLACGVFLPHLLHEEREVVCVLFKAADMRQRRVLYGAGRVPVPAVFEDPHAATAPEEIVDRLVVFLNGFRKPVGDDDRFSGVLRRKDGIMQRFPVVSGEIAVASAVGQIRQYRRGEERRNVCGVHIEVPHGAASVSSAPLVSASLTPSGVSLSGFPAETIVCMIELSL